MQILLRAVITGFGLKLGADIYKLVTKTLGFTTDDDDDEGEKHEASQATSRRSDDEDDDASDDDEVAPE